MRFRIALYLAVIAGSLTLAFGIINDIRIIPLLKRILISITAFGVCGFMVGVFVEHYTGKLSSSLNEKGQNIDIITEEEDITNIPNTSFSPLTPDKFEKISDR